MTYPRPRQVASVELGSHSGPARDRERGVKMRAVAPGGPEQPLTLALAMEVTYGTVFQKP